MILEKESPIKGDLQVGAINHQWFQDLNQEVAEQVQVDAIEVTQHLGNEIQVEVAVKDPLADMMV